MIRCILLLACLPLALFSQDKAPKQDSLIRGFCIAAPTPSEHPRFVKFIREELASRKVNTLILRVDFGYEYKSHPELRDAQTLSSSQVKELVAVCRENGINLIPQVNLLGHQSWAEQTGKLLEIYPQLDETPHVKMPEKHKWPNADGLYCKSYCPLHPEVHPIVFALVDEIMEVFEASDFHAGMDEVFYIGDDHCPRCGGRDKAELFAGEVNRIRHHLHARGRRLWIWGDRLLDGKTTGLGMWEGSMNNTHRSVDLIEKDVLICDWHYDRAEPTAHYLAMKGFDVVTCPWNKPAVAVSQYHDMNAFHRNANPALASRYRGMMQTVWSGAGSFMDAFYKTGSANGTTDCFRQLFDLLNQ